MMQVGQTLILAELFESNNLIEIPLIQRDYAQGRRDAKHVRAQFLKSIKDILKLSTSELRQPLDLDFIYGSVNEHGNFIVLDGQQRLTTLFLLHWYMAQKASRIEHFQSIFTHQSRSKFTYKTRTSATEFFDGLVLKLPLVPLSSENRPSEFIRDQQWFFQSWDKDPTVYACLNMLDVIHTEFCSCDENVYDKLFMLDSPYITFQYLNLESFGLTDELYIKMNARGKPLSEFENFKAFICKKVEHLPNGREFERKLDLSWTDIFWTLNRGHPKQFDDLYLRFFNLISFYYACENIEGAYDSLDKSKRTWIEKIRTRSDYLEPEFLNCFDILSDNNLQRIEEILDFFSDENNRLTSLLDGLEGIDYLSLAKFYATLLFIERNQTPSFESAVFTRWKRVTNNLLNNHRFDEMSTLLPVLRALRDLSNNSHSIYQYLVKNEFNKGFSAPQRNEETLKAELIMNDEEWESILINSESHNYLQGKVGFILENSKVDDGAYSKVLFKEQAKKVSILFSDYLLKDTRHRLQRALLTQGNYSLHDKSNVFSLCSSESSTYRHRSENWFKVVDGDEFTNLLNKLDVDAVVESLDKIITSADCDGWRQLLVEHPGAIAYCKNSRFSMLDGRIYLLSKSSMRGYHAELYTYVLYLKLRSHKEHLDIIHLEYHFVYGHEVPYVYLKLNDNEDIKICHNGKSFYGFKTLDENLSYIDVVLPESINHIINLTFQSSG